MPSFLRILGGGLAALAALVGFGVFWRWLSRRVALPCPAALSWLVENRLMERVAGSELLLDRLGLEPGMRMLDAGCGPGRLTIPAARRVGPAGEVVAVDVQPEMLRRTAAKAAAAGLGNVRLLQAAVGDGRIGELETFDRAVLVTVLGEIVDREAALAEIFAALKPGGVLAVTEVLPDPHYLGAATVRRLGETAGFRARRPVGPRYAFTLDLIKPEAAEPTP